ncbi:hypothetical protein [Polycladidibacter stylochi]|uniref:hypothetical protein n=1 Tax=Polycladidibacter stylochi TaxID=1807766 RepID=UPI000830346C|nr:hypothetical protein [Pseudovibrio stylochi]
MLKVNRSDVKSGCIEEEAFENIKRSLVELGYQCVLKSSRRDKILRNLYSEASDVISPLNCDLIVKFNGVVHRIKPKQEIMLPEDVVFDLCGIGADTCFWVYGYELAATLPATRVLRREGLLTYEDWQFYHMG